MQGIYIHIPFCHQKCSYCDFYFSTLIKHKSKFFEALLQEIDFRKNEIARYPIATIYFGGGTPSVLSAKEITTIIECIGQYNQLRNVKEITLEANPEDLSTSYLADLKTTAINRLSIGTQSFSDKELQLLGRKHTAQQAIASIKNAQKAGFENITVDIIYGISTNFKSDLMHNLSTLKELDIPHFSAYALTVEPQTLLAHQIKQKQFLLPDDELFEYCFNTIHDFAMKNNFEHYELSNFAKTNFRSLHNSNYWTNKPYIGLGPSAHSFDGNKSRRANIANIHLYAQNIKNKKPYYQIERLSAQALWNEWLMVRLRTAEGLELKNLPLSVYADFIPKMLTKIKQFPKDWYSLTDTQFKLTPKGWFVSDYILKELFV